MQTQGNKAVVSRFFLKGLGESNPDEVDEVFAPEHILSSPEFGTETVTGTQAIKDVIEDFSSDKGEVTCTIQRQIEEGDWVATSYTLSEAEDHMGIMISRIVDGKIQESHVVAKTVSGPRAPRATDSVTKLRRAFN